MCHANIIDAIKRLPIMGKKVAITMKYISF
jgi:hypothetical protein